QRRVTDTGKAPKQAEIEFPLATVPSVVAGRGRVLNDRQQPTDSEFTKILAPERSRGLADELDIAERAAAERIDTPRPSFCRPFPRLGNVVFQLGSRLLSAHCNPRQSDTGRPVAPLAGPGRLTFGAQIRPIVAACIKGRIFKGNA